MPNRQHEFKFADAEIAAKPKLTSKVLGAVKSVLGNPLVKQALTALVLKKLTKRK
jgi:hypothetical protein